MLDPIIHIVQFLIGVYWAGEVARQNIFIDSFVSSLESGYKQFNQNIKEREIVAGLRVVRKLYAWLTVICFVCLVIILFLQSSPNKPISFFYISFILFFLGWFSLEWCLNHRKIFTNTTATACFMIFSPLALGILGFLTGDTHTVQIMTEPFSEWLTYLGFQAPSLTHPIACGALISATTALIFIIYYVSAWILSIPAAFISTIAISTPVFLARFIHFIAPKTPFFGFTVILMAVCCLVLQT